MPTLRLLTPILTLFVKSAGTCKTSSLSYIKLAIPLQEELLRDCCWTCLL
jgi:hypothetical protein